MPIKILSPQAQLAARLNQPQVTRAQAARQIRATLRGEPIVWDKLREKKKSSSIGRVRKVA